LRAFNSIELGKIDSFDFSVLLDHNNVAPMSFLVPF
jgi:hypothetical protein